MSYPQCIQCKQFLASNACLAFPAGIPDDIYFNRVSHKLPYEGDNGIQFEEK